MRTVHYVMVISFAIANHGKTHEVGVDAKTGAILENGIETKAD